MSASIALLDQENTSSAHRRRPERRQEILALRRKKKKIERRLQRVFLDVEFDNQTATGFGNFHLLRFNFFAFTQRFQNFRIQGPSEVMQ